MKVCEIFHSIQGEGEFSGYPTIFIRLTGCNLRCRYCDTQYAFYEGEDVDVDEIMKRIEPFKSRYVCVTGGEPLLQEETPNLIETLLKHKRGYMVLLEEEGIKSTNIKSRILEGLPSKRIIKYANRKDADLIAMRVYSRKATTSAQRIGSTVKNVLKRSHVPVLTLAEECNKFPIKKVLFATDGSGKSKRAKNFAILFSSYYKTELEVLHVIEDNERESHGKNVLKNVEWKASFMNVKVKKSLEKGDVAEKILQHAMNNDILIMGIGRQFLFMHYLGHVTQAVCTHAPIPVIFVRCMKKRWEKRELRK